MVYLNDMSLSVILKLGILGYLERKDMMLETVMLVFNSKLFRANVEHIFNTPK